MLITKFNQLIGNKWVWGAFAVLACLSLLGFVGPSINCSRAVNTTQYEGLLSGQGVTPQEFTNARFFEMGMGKNVPRTAAESQILRDRAWKRLATLRMAKAMGITASDEEVRQVVIRDSNFAENGAFSPKRYQTIIERQLQTSVATFEEYLRQAITMRKLQHLLTSATWVAPTELESRLRNLTDAIKIEYTLVTPNPKQDETPVTDKEIKDFYNEDPKLFTLAEKRSVKYIAFTLASYRQTNETTEAEVMEYYDAHLDQYSTLDTNGLSVPRPMEEVRAEIVKNLAATSSVFKAQDAATSFLLGMIPDKDGKALSFDAAAAAAGMQVKTSEFFTASTVVSEVDAGETFSQEAFTLTTNENDRLYSNPVVGREAVYVMMLNAIHEPRVPALDEVKDSASALLQRRKMQTAFSKRAAALHDEIARAMKSGRTFTEATAPRHLAVTTTETFTVYENLTSNKLAYSEQLLGTVANQEKGELSPLLPTAEGLMLAAVTQRAAGDPMTFQMLRPQLVQMLAEYRSGMVFNDWTEALLKKADLKDYRATPTDLDVEPEEAPPAQDTSAKAGSPATPN